MFKGMAVFILAFFLSAAAVAEDLPLKMTFNHNELIRLERDAASVVVNNPDRISVHLESPRLLVIIPHMAGMTSFQALDAQGGVVMQRDVIVSNVESKKKYLRVRRMCQGSDSSCAPAVYSYCPNGCYDVTPVAKGSGAAPAAPSSSAAAAEQEPPTINGEPIETMIGPSDSCPEGYNAVPVPEDPTGQGRKCVQ